MRGTSFAPRQRQPSIDAEQVDERWRGDNRCAYLAGACMNQGRTGFRGSRRGSRSTALIRYPALLGEFYININAVRIAVRAVSGPFYVTIRVADDHFARNGLPISRTGGGVPALFSHRVIRRKWRIVRRLLRYL